MDDNKILKMYWEGKISKMEILSIKSFIFNGHTVHLYTYDSQIKPFDNNMKVLDASDIIERQKRSMVTEKTSTVFSDLFRYNLLYKTGGWWVDLDTVLIRPIITESPIVASLHFNANPRVEDLNNSPLKIPRGHALAESCVRNAESRDLKKISHGQLSGGLLQQEISRLKLDQFIVSSEIYSPIGWGEVHRVVSPSFGFDRITQKTVAVHLFANMWAFKKIDKNGVFPKNSLYEWLKEKYKVS